VVGIVEAFIYLVAIVFGLALLAVGLIAVLIVLTAVATVLLSFWKALTG
jgi:hypothetical protein